MATKKFRLIDAILSVITVVFVAEAAAPAAAIGNSQFFWWIFLIIAFLLPYGLVVSELGTTYDDEGGLYDWVRRAFGDRWGSRVSWYYWINFPLWMASLAILFPETIALITGFELDLLPALAIELAFIWIVVFLSFSKVSDSAWILNLSAVLKVGIALLVGGLGIWYALTFGFANDMAPETFLPSFDANGLTYLSIILFNFMGFEVITTYVGSMENPSRQIPRAIIAGGIAIAALYLFSSFGIGAAIPAEDISLDSGIMDAVGIMAGVGSALFVVVGIVFLVTLFGNMVSWSFGVNFVAEHAAKKGNMPRPFARESEKNQMPTGAAVINGVVASALVLLAPVMELAGFDGFFWIFFSMNIVFLLISYIPMFPAFLKLRRVDAAAPRVFKVPGGRGVLLVATWLPVVLLVLSIIATIVPLNGSEEEMSKIPMLIGVIAFVLIGEVVRVVSARGRTVEYRGMDASGDPLAFDVAQGYVEMPESEKIAVEEDRVIGREPRDLM
ncbi:APC family permease [Rubneribacter badeniensis]|uniref:APC family permease n=1 Tax=Rubneribacter badeniensis TaxID=2070688 RepID=A0A2K2U4T8_9ACTN|nr:APC family permease [Rubneribacter badeniensis]OUO92171.1 amino acid:proton antiporter [Gordonibacter sp. An232A]PNV65345.1 APC family permease [Rubneribacter badeniensis]CVH75422.1 putative glutamate/gamma-aminobutyrate antiporter [Coriobacteriaceae bacterium CHKCI002]